MVPSVELVTSYIQYLQQEKRYSAHTCAAYGNDLRQFCRYLHQELETSLEACTEVEFKNWLATLHQGHFNLASIRRKASTVRSFYNWWRPAAQQNVSLPQPSMTSLPRSRIHHRSRQLPTVLDQQAFSEEAFSSEDESLYKRCLEKAIIAVLLGGGLRVSELIGLKGQDVKLEEPIKLNFSGKGGRHRIVPIPETSGSYFLNYWNLRRENQHPHPEAPVFVRENGKGIYRMWVYRLCRNWGREVLGRDDVHPHALRHTYATALLDAGADLYAIKSLLGHSSLAATQIYSHVATQKKLNEYQKAHPRAEK